MDRQLGRWLLAASLAIGACQGGPGPTVGPTAPPSAASGTSPEPSVGGAPLADRLEAEIEVPGAPDWPQAAFGSLWLLAPDLPIQGQSGTPNLVRIDPATNSIAATITLQDRLCQGFVPGDDAIWVCSSEGLVRIDPATNQVTERIAIPDISRTFYQPAFGDGAVWALGSAASVSDTVIRFEPGTGTATPFTQSAPIGGLAYGFDALWLTLTREGSVLRLDPATGETEVLAAGLADPGPISIGSDSLWVSLRADPEAQARPGDTQLARIDPTSGEVLAEFEIGGSPQGGVLAWAGEGGVLVRSTQPWLVRIDEARGEVVDAIVAEPPVQGPVTFAFESIWPVNVERDVVYRVSP
ncbi:MAG: hypothetical protein FIA92_18265 [Chloroflexi bacterium]|nr:hypothetical protein [Chloroflexota bacterium]